MVRTTWELQMQVVWMVLVTLGAGPRRGSGGLAVAQVPPGRGAGDISPPVLAGPWLEWRSGAPLGAGTRRQQSRVSLLAVTCNCVLYYAQT
jgi:hypothetical protein